MRSRKNLKQALTIFRIFKLLKYLRTETRMIFKSISALNLLLALKKKILFDLHFS